jgi:PHD/YefM family antitoxin component YafN of YafNO toxin-antitoxin module
MSDPSMDFQSLSDFSQNSMTYVEQLKVSGTPLVLTVDGRPEVVVLEAGRYRQLLEMAERAEAIDGIRRGLDSFVRGEGRLASEAFTELRLKHGIPEDA